jgi:trigger factor
LLQRKLEAHQREQVRQQVLEQLMDQVSFQLPEKLIESEAKAVLRRRVLRMRRLGYSEDQIRTQMPALYERSLQESARDLREHFVLSKIAEAEGIEVSEEDVEQAIAALAMQNNTSPRRVRAQLNQENMMPLLEVELLEQMTIDRILEYAEYEDVPGELPEELEKQEEEGNIYAVNISVVPEQERPTEEQGGGEGQPAATDSSGPAGEQAGG